MPIELEALGLFALLWREQRNARFCDRGIEQAVGIGVPEVEDGFQVHKFTSFRVDE